MHKHLIAYGLSLIFGLTPCLVQASPVSQLETMSNGKSVLYVDGNPFQPYGVQLRVDERYVTGLTNTQMDPWFQWAKALNANTVEIPVHWADCESSDNVWNFTNVDWAIAQAKANGLKMELLWFGSNVCGTGWSNVLPPYFSTYTIFQPMLYANGDIVGEIYPPNAWPGPNTLASNGTAPYYYSNGDGNKISLSVDSANTQWYENRAVTKLMQHLATIDPGPAHTVIGFQVEDEPTIAQTNPIVNEIDRDHSTTSNAYWTGSLTALAFDQWRLSLYLNRVASWVKACPNSMYTRVNYDNDFNTTDESVSALRTYSPNVNSVGLDTYGMSQYTMWGYETGAFATAGNAVNIGEQPGGNTQDVNDLIDLLAANGDGESIYDLASSVNDGNALYSFTGTAYTSEAAQIQSLYATLDKVNYYMAIRRASMSTPEINFYNSGGNSVASGTVYDYAMSLNGRSVEYWSNSGGQGINFITTPGSSTSPMCIVGNQNGSFTISGGYPTKIQLGYYDNTGAFHVQGDSYWPTGTMTYADKGSGTFQIWLYAGEVAQIQFT